MHDRWPQLEPGQLKAPLDTSNVFIFAKHHSRCSDHVASEHGPGTRSRQWNAIRRAAGQSLVYRGRDRVRDRRVHRQRVVHPADTTARPSRYLEGRTTAQSPTDAGMPFTLHRRQFPIRPAFAMTIKCAGPNAEQVRSAARRAHLYSWPICGGLSLFVDNFQTVDVVYKEVLS